MEEHEHPKETEAQFESDPIIPRPQPERGILVRAHRYTLRDETPIEKYIRQHWEHTISAVRVALDTWREIWPIEAADHFEEGEEIIAREIAHDLEHAYLDLSLLGERVNGLIHQAQTFTLSHKDLDLYPGASE